ncbi:hypothetical protein JVX91_17695 [Pseudomonas sp. PDNC002]|uniref:hypothetical protein n=1 Tax=Pseudomonas sp. PDNC002 TaxID=2811422 RepID=UPI0019655753|nr:hypothetical protein [Pseudomonas sp. PDNC002]QRY77437.1 hypothetical protein JVX91_17695 [Pseudomonas sp. PDNC002]
MRCTHILSLTFVGPDDDPEMNASHEAMATKGSKHGARLVNTKVVVPDNPTATTLFQAANVNIAFFNGAQSIGLYLAAHYVASDNSTFPSMQLLAELTAKFLEAGLRFRKINLNACFSAGKIGHQIELGIKYEPNMILDFCNHLVGTLNNGGFFGNQQPMSLTVLNNCMVAGYRSQVVLYKPGHAFFTRRNTDPYEWSKKLDNRIGNVFRDSGGYSRAHPQSVGAHNNRLGQFDHKTHSKYENLIKAKDYSEVDLAPPWFDDAEYPAITINEAVLGTPLLKEIKAGKFFRDQQGLAVYFQAVLQYIMKKKIVRFDNAGQISQISIADYSDNPNIQEMVTAVTIFNRDMDQLGVRIIL